MPGKKALQHYVGFGQLDSVSGSTGTLPAGLILGEERQEGALFYRLMYNEGNSEGDQGDVMSPIASGGGPYSCTITTTSDGMHGYGAVVVHNATVPTGFFFWGAFKGYPVKVKAGTASIATGGSFMVAIDGTVSTATTAATAAIIGQRNTRVIVGENIGGATTTTVTTDTRSGDCYINFPPYLPAAV